MNSVCFVIPYLSDGGAERVTSILASKLADFGYSVFLILSHRVPNEYSVSDKVDVRYLVDGFRSDYSSLKFTKKIKLLRRVLKNIRPDFVVPLLPHVAIQVAIAGFGMKFKTIQTVRVAPSKSPESKLFRTIRDFQVSHAFSVFVQTESQKQYFAPKIHNKITVLPNPVADDFFEVEHEHGEIKKFISVGRLSPQKNFKLAIDAICSIRSQGYDVSLNIFGEGELYLELQKYIRSKDAERFCKLGGRSNNIIEEYKKADAFLLTSDYEGMPNALLEAMACGLPCIASDCETGPKELIGEDRGLLFPVGNLNRLTGCILQFLNDKDSAKFFGTKAEKYVRENFSSKTIADRFVKEVLQIHN